MEGIDVVAPASLRHLIEHLAVRSRIDGVRVDAAGLFGDVDGRLPDFDYADVRGQELAKRALEIAAAGQHNILMVGPPGSGKSMLARRLPGILPPLTIAEAVEVTRVHSVAGRLGHGQALVTTRPFRAPHHTASEAALVGGGSWPRPGEVSLAHHGVLFLDELPEFRRSALESLRQPLEDGVVHVGRARQSVAFPAKVMLAASMNPCPCGHFGDGEGRCVCHAGQVRRYMQRISGPILDRFDVYAEVPSLPPRELLARGATESSSAIRARVVAARARQQTRFRTLSGVYANAQMGPREIGEWCRLDERGETLLKTAIRKLHLSARAYHRILKLARTIADLEGAEFIAAAHVGEAVQHRSLDRMRVVATV